MTGKFSSVRYLAASFFVVGSVLIILAMGDLLGYTSTFVLVGCSSGPVPLCVRGLLVRHFSYRAWFTDLANMHSVIEAQFLIPRDVWNNLSMEVRSVRLIAPPRLLLSFFSTP